MNRPIDLVRIAQALTVIHTQGSHPNDIHTANAYLAEMETAEGFAGGLLEIYAGSEAGLQLSAVLLLGNVVKRGWAGRGRGKGTLDRESIKVGVIKASLLHEMRHYKHFNALLRPIVRSIYPGSYLELHTFVVDSLMDIVRLGQNTPEQLLSNGYVTPVLSMVKGVLKEYSNKRIAHCQTDFKDYIVPVVNAGVQLSALLQPLIKQSLGHAGVDVALLRIARKADKIILYGLLSMPTSYQSEAQIVAMVRGMVGRVHEYDEALGSGGLSADLREQLQLYLIGVLELVSKMQHTFPFLFAEFLKEYMVMVVGMVMVNVAQGRYAKEKLISTAIIAVMKLVNTYAYYATPKEFQGSVYCRKSSMGNNELQVACYGIFNEVLSGEVVERLLVGLVSEVMGREGVWEEERGNLEELVLEEVQIAIVDQVGEPSAYDNALSLCKLLLKNFRLVGLAVVTHMLEQAPRVRKEGERGARIATNVLQIALYLPQTLNDELLLPWAPLHVLMDIFFKEKQFMDLSKLIRKYYQFMGDKMRHDCVNLLVGIVSSPIGPGTPPETIYQAALALKSMLSQSYDFDEVSSQILSPCIGNIISIMGMKQFSTNPTLLWPVINLVIKLLGTCYMDKQKAVLGVTVVRGVGGLLGVRNQQLLACALFQLLATIVQHALSFIRNDYPDGGVESEQVSLMRVAVVEEGLGAGLAVILQGAILLVRANIDNPALQNYDVVYRFWLTLLRHYPTRQQQARLGMDLSKLNGQLVELFEGFHVQLMEDCRVMFLEVVEEMFLLGLTELDQGALGEEQEQEKRVRSLLASVSLYLSFALLRGHQPGLLGVLLRELIELRNRINPAINTLRCFIYLAIDHFILTRNSGEAFSVLTAAAGGNLIDWFQPFLFSMQYTTTKEISKLNAATVLKVIGEVGVGVFAQMLMTPREGQYPMDWLLRCITAKLQAIAEGTRFNEDSFYRSILPNDFSADSSVVKLRKLRLQFGNSVVQELMRQDLGTAFRERFGAVLLSLNWGVDDLEERVGYSAAATLANHLGWPTDKLVK